MRTAISTLRLITLSFLLVLSASVFAHCQHGSLSRISLDRWLQDPEVHLPGWSVQIDSPFLAFPLRMAVEVYAKADLEKLKAVGHTLHFFVKVADSKGRWFPERRYSSIGNLPKSGGITVAERFYAKPGDYTVALVVYDSTSGKHGVWKRSVHVEENDGLPTYPSAAAVEFFDPSEPFKPGEVPALPPVENRKPLRMDIVVNLTERTELELGDQQDLVAGQLSHSHAVVRPVVPEWQLGLDRQEAYTDSLLSVAELVAQTNLKGCVRVSVVDAARGKVLLDRRSSFEPGRMFAAVREHRNTNKVDAHVLAARQNAGSYFRSFLEEIIGDDSGCGSEDLRTARAIVVISDSLLFPDSKQLTPLGMPAAATHSTRFYLFRLSVKELMRLYTSRAGYTPMPIARGDHVARLFQYLDVTRFDLSQPKDLQKALPKFWDDLKDSEQKAP